MKSEFLPNSHTDLVKDIMPTCLYCKLETGQLTGYIFQALSISGDSNSIFRVWQGNCQKKTENYLPSVFHTFIDQSHRRKSSPKRSVRDKWFIKVNNGVTSSNQPVPQKLSSQQPWFPHTHEEKDKKNDAFDTFYRKSMAGLQKFFKRILFGWRK